MFHVDLSPFGVDVERLKSDRLSACRASCAPAI